jgi:hypothetical protein
MNFYAYLHARPHTEDAYGIFYVGKGKDGRGLNLRRKNPHHRNIVKKYQGNILVGQLECSSEEVAFELEVGLIKCLKRMGVVLVNRTSGGDGVRGRVVSEEWRKNHSELMKGRPNWAKGRTVPQEQRDKISATLKSTSPWRGRKHTEAARSRMGKAGGSVWVNDGISSRVRAQPAEVEKYLQKGWKLGFKIRH